MKGQLSLETLILLVVGIALISISLASLALIQNNADRAFSVISFRSSAMTLEGTIDEVCMMGKGNQIEITLREPMSMKTFGNRFDIIHDTSGESLEFESSCDLEGFSNLEDQVLVMHKDKIKVIPLD